MPLPRDEPSPSKDSPVVPTSSNAIWTDEIRDFIMRSCAKRLLNFKQVATDVQSFLLAKYAVAGKSGKVQLEISCDVNDKSFVQVEVRHYSADACREAFKEAKKNGALVALEPSAETKFFWSSLPRNLKQIV
jgi:hypothetical protein